MRIRERGCIQIKLSFIERRVDICCEPCRLADAAFCVAFLMSVHMKRIDDTDCLSRAGIFTCFLTQYSLLASEITYLFLAVDGLVSVSRPFSNPKTRYTLFLLYSFFTSSYGVTIHAASIAMALLLVYFGSTGRHVSGLCWIRDSKRVFNLLYSLNALILVNHGSSCLSG